MRYGQERRLGAQRGEAPRCPVVKPKLRRALMADDLDPAPLHFRGAACAESLHGRLFRCESTREMDGRVAPPSAVGDLALGEDAVDEPFAEAFDGGGDARNVGGIDAQTDDVRHV